MPATVTHAEAVRPTSSADGVSWDLHDLYAGVDDAHIGRDLDAALGRAPDEPARALAAAPLLARYRHYLEQKRLWRPHYLSEPEEKVLEEKAVTGRAAFVRLFDETVAGMLFPFVYDGRAERLPLQQVNAKLYDPDRGVRRAAAEGLTRGL